jgi:hypothetical protein
MAGTIFAEPVDNNAEILAWQDMSWKMSLQIIHYLPCGAKYGWNRYIPSQMIHHYDLV